MSPKIVALFLAGLIGFLSEAKAAGLEITPLGLNFEPQTPITTLTLSNKNNEPSSWQLFIVNWTQENSVNHYSPNHDFIIMPMIFRLRPGQTQLVRIAKQSSATGDVEQAYRLYLKQLPEPPNFESEKSGKLTVLLNISLPMFKLPSQIHRGFQTKAIPLSPQREQINILNTGNVHLVLTRYRLETEKNQICFKSDPQLVYILPHQNWQLIQPLPPSCLKHALYFKPTFQD